MQVYYLQNGEIHQALYDADVFRANVEPTAQILEIDEIPENKQICRELAAQVSLYDASGLGRWYVENGELFERENWTPEVP